MAPKIVDGGEVGFCEECEQELSLDSFSHYDPEEDNICDSCLDDLGDEIYREDYDSEEEEDVEFEE